jgi:hypothetical protein
MTYKIIHEFKCDYCRKIKKSESPLLPIGWAILQENLEDETTHIEYYCSREHLGAYNGSRSNGRSSK